MADKTTLVTELRQAKYIDVLPSYDSISYREGKARIVEGGIKVDDIHIRANKVIIATGSSASLPPIKGIDTVPYLTSTTALEIDHLPESMIVIGGGVIGCELGQMFARMGSKVTIFCRSHLLPSEEPEVSKALEDALVAEGIQVECGVVYQSITADDGICLAYEKSGQHYDLTAEQVLVTTGRRANSAGLGLEEMGVELLPNQGIKVDGHMQTTCEGVFAVGDVTGRDMYVYMAAYGAKLAAHNALNCCDQKEYDNSAMPRVTFTDPQVASVGLTEAQARNKGYEVKTSVLGLEHVPRALAARDMRGLIKLVAEKDSGKLIGASIIAPEGADCIQTAAIAIKVGMTNVQLGEMVFPYLTTVEGFKLAAQTFEKDVSKLSCCAG